MKIRDFTVPELDMFRELCNFTDEELEYFNLRSKDKTNSEISYLMNVSEAKIDEASSDKERQAIMQCIEKLEG